LLLVISPERVDDDIAKLTRAFRGSDDDKGRERQGVFTTTVAIGLTAIARSLSFATARVIEGRTSDVVLQPPSDRKE
jgi:hypothetical protein